MAGTGQRRVGSMALLTDPSRKHRCMLEREAVLGFLFILNMVSSLS